MTQQAPLDPYQAPQHGGTAAYVPAKPLPFNRRRVWRAIITWFGFLAVSGIFSLLVLLLKEEDRPPSWPLIIVLTLGMANLFAFLGYNVLLMIRLLRGDLRRP